jgi:hypothetical protein
MMNFAGQNFGQQNSSKGFYSKVGKNMRVAARRYEMWGGGAAAMPQFILKFSNARICSIGVIL